MGQKTDYFNKANTLLFLFSFKKIASKIDKQVMLSYLLLFNKRLEFNFFLTPSKIPTCTSQALQHLHITTEKNLTSNHCLKLKCLGFSLLKYIVLTFC